MDACDKLHLVSQITSGRWILTIVSAGCLLFVTVADCWLAVKGQKLLVDPGVITTLIGVVFTAYFNKPADPKPLNGVDPATVELLGKK